MFFKLISIIKIVIFLSLLPSAPWKLLAISHPTAFTRSKGFEKLVTISYVFLVRL